MLTQENEMTTIEQLQAKIAKLEAQAASPLPMKVTGKGGVSVYGLGRFPVTLYKSQWDKLLAAAPVVAQFIEDHVDVLSVKN